MEYTCESGHRRGARWGFDAGVHVYMSCVCVYPLLDDVVDSLLGLEDAAEGLEFGGGVDVLRDLPVLRPSSLPAPCGR